jgi:ribosomal protein S8
MLLYSTLAILNQAVKNKSKLARIPYNKKGLDIIKILYNLGYIVSYNLDFNKIIVELRYYQDNPVLNGFFFYSRPGHVKTISINKLRQVFKRKNKIFILSTSIGICTTQDALRLNIGGILLAEIK